jgi:hypothetical protein
MPENKKLIFLYNAKSGLWNGVIDYVHKNVSPDTYACNLCAISYDNLGMKKGWKKFIQELEIDSMFLHLDEWQKEFGSQAPKAPAVFIQEKTKSPKLLISPEEINSLKDLDGLEGIVVQKLKNYS